LEADKEDDMKRTILTASILALSLGACGYSQGDRALSGAGIGAGLGAGAAAITGGNPVTGAVIGGAAGAATGAFTDPDDINLDRDRRRPR